MNEHITIATENGKVTGIIAESTDGAHYSKQEIFPEELREEYKKLKAENESLKVENKALTSKLVEHEFVCRYAEHANYDQLEFVGGITKIYNSKKLGRQKVKYNVHIACPGAYSKDGTCFNTYDGTESFEIDNVTKFINTFRVMTVEHGVEILRFTKDFRLIQDMQYPKELWLVRREANNDSTNS